MTPKQYRKSRSWSLERLALELGLKASSAGHLSRLERGEKPWPTDLAVKLQRLSEGQVSVADLRPDLADVVVTGAAQPQAVEARA